MGEIKITYETLFDLLRREKSRDELQKLDPSFYKDVQAYLCEKQNFLQDNNPQAELFASSEKEKIRIQFQNIKKLLKELYERREKKILHMALAKSRTSSVLMDTSAFLENENQLFQELTQLLNRYRDYTLVSLLSMTFSPTPVVMVADTLAESSTENLALASQPPETEPTVVITKSNLTIRFKAAVPKFLGTELEIYGPYEANDIAELPVEIAQILLLKGRAEEIK